MSAGFMKFSKPDSLSSIEAVVICGKIIKLKNRLSEWARRHKTTGVIYATNKWKADWFFFLGRTWGEKAMIEVFSKRESGPIFNDFNVPYSSANCLSVFTPTYSTYYIVYDDYGDNNTERLWTTYHVRVSSPPGSRCVVDDGFVDPPHPVGQLHQVFEAPFLLRQVPKSRDVPQVLYPKALPWDSFVGLALVLPNEYEFGPHIFHGR